MIKQISGVKRQTYSMQEFQENELGNLLSDKWSTISHSLTVDYT